MSGYEEIANRLKKGKLVIMDGGTGSEIYRRGARGRYDLPWAVNGLVYAPETVRQIHQDYFQKGAHVVTADSFYTTEYALATASKVSRTDFSGQANSLTYLAIYLAKDASRLARERGFLHEMCIAGSVGPLEVENPYDARNTPQSFTIQAENKERMNCIKEAGADLLLVETMTTLHEACANVELIQKLELEMPFWISFSCRSDGHLRSGEEVEKVVSMLDKYPLKPNALLINCTEPKAITRALKNIRDIGVKIPLGAKANLEERIYKGSSFFERPKSVSSQAYAMYCRNWNENFGVQILGGCCGTNPEDIEAITKALKHKI
jgi:S-methylmethionine-dependent homocysteine/selenocysteine methylase